MLQSGVLGRYHAADASAKNERANIYIYIQKAKSNIPFFSSPRDKAWFSKERAAKWLAA